MFISHSPMLSSRSLQSQSLQMSKNGCFFAGSLFTVIREFHSPTK